MKCETTMLALVAMLWACGPAPTPPTAATTTPPPIPATATAAVATPTPPQPSATPVSVPVTAPSPFVPVAQINLDFRFFPIQGALLLAGRDIEPKDDFMGTRFGIIRDGAIELPEKLILDSWITQIVDVVGRWPDQVDVLAVGSTGRTGTADRYRMQSGRVVAGRSSVGQLYAGATTFGASVVAIAPAAMFGPSSIETLRGPKVPFNLKPASGPECNNTFGVSELVPSAMRGTPDGRLVLVGVNCNAEPTSLIFEQGKAKKFAKLPPAIGETRDPFDGGTTLIGDGANGLWLISGGVARFEGDVWTEVVPAPAAGPLVDGAVDGDGVLWVLGQGTVYRLVGDVLEAVALPPKSTVTDIAVDESGTLWLTGGGVLMRHGAGAAQAIALTPLKQTRDTPERPKPPKPGSSSCAVNNIVVLYGFTKVTPEDYDFPLTRQAVAGHHELSGTKFLVTKDLGQKFFVAQVQSFDKGVELQALIKKKVVGSSPQIICAEPEVVREIKIDLTTGNVKP